jgi:hypothetical protein
VPTVAEEPNLGVLESTAAVLGTESNALSFRRAIEGQVYTKTGDGYYYDLEGVRYRPSGKEGQYTYEQVFEADDDHVSSSGCHGFQGNRLCNCRHSLKVANPPELQLLYDCGTPLYKRQDEVPTQSSQAAAPTP